MNLQTVNYTSRSHGQEWKGSHDQATSAAHQAVDPHTSRADLRLTRGIDAPSGESPPRSRAGRPLGRISASLEGWTPPRANLRIARGRPELAAPAPTPPTRELNVGTTRAHESKANVATPAP
jgi:hypothetical protein